MLCRVCAVRYCRVALIGAVLTVLCCAEQAHLKPFLPTHPMVPTGGLPKFDGDEKAFGTMAAAPFGSSLILPISYAYISMMGSEGLTEVPSPCLTFCLLHL